MIKRHSLSYIKSWISNYITLQHSACSQIQVVVYLSCRHIKPNTQHAGHHKIIFGRLRQVITILVPYHVFISYSDFQRDGNEGIWIRRLQLPARWKSESVKTSKLRGLYGHAVMLQFVALWSSLCQILNCTCLCYSDVNELLFSDELPVMCNIAGTQRFECMYSCSSVHQHPFWNEKRTTVATLNKKGVAYPYRATVFSVWCKPQSCSYFKCGLA